MLFPALGWHLGGPSRRRTDPCQGSHQQIIHLMMSWICCDPPRAAGFFSVSDAALLHPGPSPEQLIGCCRAPIGRFSGEHMLTGLFHYLLIKQETLNHILNQCSFSTITLKNKSGFLTNSLMLSQHNTIKLT